jgi:hypothetical protein
MTTVVFDPLVMNPLPVEAAEPPPDDDDFITFATVVNQSIFSDNFERSTGLGSNWVVSATTGSAGISTHTSNSGTRSMFTRWGIVSVTSIAFDTSAYQYIWVNYWVRRGSDAFSEDPEGSDEDLIVEYLNATNSWIQLDNFQGGGTAGQIYNSKHNLSGDALHSGFKLRFRQTGGDGSDNDYYHIDDVEIKGTYEEHDISVVDTTFPNIGELNKTVTIKALVKNIGINNEKNITVQLKIDGVLYNETNITSLLKFTQTVINFTWIPNSTGLINLTIYAVNVSGETVIWNNIKNGTINITAQPDFWIKPAVLNLNAYTGETTTGNITIGNNGTADLNWDIYYNYTVFSDDFEDGDYNGWFIGSGGYQRAVTSTTAAAGTTYSYTQNGNSFYGIGRSFGPNKPNYVGFYTRCARTDRNASNILLSDTGWSVTRFYFTSNSTLCLDSENGQHYINFPYLADTWYHIEFQDINWKDKNFDLYVNDTLLKTNIPFLKSQASGLATIHLFKHNFHS